MGDNKEEKLDDSNEQNDVEKSDAVSIKEEKEKNCQNGLDDKHVFSCFEKVFLNIIALPKPVRRLVKALKGIQLEHVNKEAEFFKELYDLEIKYESICKPLYEKRAAIVSGAYIPTDEECEFQSNSDKELQLSNEFQQLVKLKEGADKESKMDDLKGIPYFWLTAFTHAPPLLKMIQEYDKPVLKHLIDVKATTYKEPMSYTLEFHFEPNDYFKNAVLTKHYELKCTPDEDDVFAFEGLEILKAKGCSIDWNEGKNVTLKAVKMYKKNKILGGFRVVTKRLQRKSFFNFFNPPTVPENGEMDEKTFNAIRDDYEIGNILKEKLVPYAVLFFTGDNVVDDDEYEEEEAVDEDTEEDSDTDDMDEDEDEVDLDE